MDIGAVEVDGGAGREIGVGPGESEDIPELRAGGGHLVNVPTRVDAEDFVVNQIKDVAFVSGRNSIVACARESGWEWPRWWVGEILGEVVGVAARIRYVVDLFNEGIIEGEETTPIINELNCRDLFLNGIVRSRRIVDHGCFEVIILLIIRFNSSHINDMKVLTTEVSFLLNIASAMYGT